jgi:WhiB family redox-sensing transcriptional regulator
VTSYAIPGDWTEHAACRGEDMTVPGGEKGVGQTREARRTIERRKTICASCPVLDDCLAWATTQPDPARWLIAAGLTPDERRPSRRRKKTAA